MLQNSELCVLKRHTEQFPFYSAFLCVAIINVFGADVVCVDRIISYTVSPHCIGLI